MKRGPGIKTSEFQAKEYRWRGWRDSQPGAPVKRSFQEPSPEFQATAKQMAYIKTLCRQTGATAPSGPLTKANASLLIDGLKARISK